MPRVKPYKIPTRMDKQSNILKPVVPLGILVASTKRSVVSTEHLDKSDVPPENLEKPVVPAKNLEELMKSPVTGIDFSDLNKILERWEESIIRFGEHLDEWCKKSRRR